MSTVDRPPIKPGPMKLILDALQVRYTSVSGMGIKTGNHYELARLFGHTQIPGDFVAERDAVPDPSA